MRSSIPALVALASFLLNGCTMANAALPEPATSAIEVTVPVAAPVHNALPDSALADLLNEAKEPPKGKHGKGGSMPMEVLRKVIAGAFEAACRRAFDDKASAEVREHAKAQMSYLIAMMAAIDKHRNEMNQRLDAQQAILAVQAQQLAALPRQIEQLTRTAAKSAKAPLPAVRAVSADRKKALAYLTKDLPPGLLTQVLDATKGI